MLPVVATPLTNPMAAATLYGVHDLEVVLVRHGQQIPPERRTQEQRFDPPLSDVGERQIEAVGDHLADESIDAVYSSNLERAHRTGLAIAARHDLDVTVIDDLREIELFNAIPAGETWASMNSRPEMKEAGAEFIATGRWSAFPHGESSESFRNRINGAMSEVLSRHDGGKIVVACHGGVINTYLAELLGIDRDFWFRTAHCSVNRLLVGHGRQAVWNLNETHHLPGDLSTA